jgi:hypothetical protein
VARQAVGLAQLRRAAVHGWASGESAAPLGFRGSAGSGYGVRSLGGAAAERRGEERGGAGEVKPSVGGEAWCGAEGKCDGTRPACGVTYTTFDFSRKSNINKSCLV